MFGWLKKAFTRQYDSILDLKEDAMKYDPSNEGKSKDPRYSRYRDAAERYNKWNDSKSHADYVAYNNNFLEVNHDEDDLESYEDKQAHDVLAELEESEALTGVRSFSGERSKAFRKNFWTDKGAERALEKRRKFWEKSNKIKEETSNYRTDGNYVNGDYYDLI